MFSKKIADCRMGAAVIMVAGLAASSSAATVNYWRFEEVPAKGGSGVVSPAGSDSDGNTAKGTALVNDGTQRLRDEVTGDSTQLTGAGSPLFSSSVPTSQLPNPDPLDVTKTGNNAAETINGGGVNTRSLHFTSSPSQQIAERRSLTFTPTGAFTIEAYVKRDNSLFGGLGLATIVQETVVNDRDNNSGWGLYLHGGAKDGIAADGSLTLQMRNTTDTGFFSVSVSDTDTKRLITDEAWHHVAATRDDLGNICLYVDGTLAAKSTPYAYTGTLGSSATLPEWFGIGATLQGAASTRFNGYIDEVRLSDTALNSSQFLNAVPEPTAMAMLAIGGLLNLRRRARA